MKASILIPVKSLDTAKSRLSEKLSKLQRETLISLMLHHVINTSVSVDSDYSIFVVSKDPMISNIAASLKVNNIIEIEPGHNKALTEAAKQINQNIPLLTISADLPFITKNDIRQMFFLLQKYDAVLASSKEKTGTNAILVKKPLIVPYLFGNNSFAKFENVLKMQQLTYKSYQNDTIAFDIDTFSDFEYFKNSLRKKEILLQKFYEKVVI